MLPAYTLKATYAVRCGIDCGTAFTLARGQRNFLISAKHVFSSYPKNGNLECLASSGWISITHKLVHDGSEEDLWDDFIVFEIGDQLQQVGVTEISSVEDLHLAQEVLAFGFPVHFPSPLSVGNGGFLPPMIKAGILSSVVSADGFGYGFLLDLRTNEGMSGGPVFARDRNDREKLILAGMIKGYYSPAVTVELANESTLQHNPNSGISFCIPIQRILEIAKI
jgi:hypothetical protein